MEPLGEPREDDMATTTCAARSPAAARGHEATLTVVPIAHDADGVAWRLRVASSSDAQKVWIDMSMGEAADLGIAILAAVGGRTRRATE